MELSYGNDWKKICIVRQEIKSNNKPNPNRWPHLA